MIKKFLKFIAFILCLCLCTVAVANCAVMFSKYQKSTVDDISGSYDCILVLGASVLSDGTPCKMLAERLTLPLPFTKRVCRISFCSADTPRLKISMMK